MAGKLGLAKRREAAMLRDQRFSYGWKM
jgi:hypothetical protein